MSVHDNYWERMAAPIRCLVGGLWLSATVLADDSQGFNRNELLEPISCQQYYEDRAKPALIQPEGESSSQPFGASLFKFPKTDPCFYSRTRLGLLTAVDEAWRRPVLETQLSKESRPLLPEPISIADKLRQIIIPRVSMTNMPLSRAIEQLSEMSVEYDTGPEEALLKGVNIVLIDLEHADPAVSVNLRNLSLDKVLLYVTRSVGFQYDVEEEAVVIQKAQDFVGNSMETLFFPISRSAVIRMTGVHRLSQPLEPGKHNDDSLQPAMSLVEEEQALRGFFQRAGVAFDGVVGSRFAFDGVQLIVTQTPRNLSRMRNILSRYTAIEQVEIEAKFLEVQQGVLEELGFEWRVSKGNSFVQTQAVDGRENLRSLANAFGPRSVSESGGVVVGPEGNQLVELPNAASTFPNMINIGAQAVNTASIVSVLNGWQVQAIIRALEQQTGTDLMSSPKLTVLSGKTAEIVVAQELRYPESYGDISSEVGTAGYGSSSAGVTITAGTPQDFTMRRVGVQMAVTPTVEDGGRSISLLLEPQVTEFEGFVEYGGASLAISSGTTVSVPSGFFQPVFSVRKIRTEVNLLDGATVVMGGLTREVVKKVKDKVPILGDLPLLGRLFRSEGETNQKRNLLIFVTANCVSSGGVPQRYQPQPTSDQGVFRNPRVVTPQGLQ